MMHSEDSIEDATSKQRDRSFLALNLGAAKRTGFVRIWIEESSDPGQCVSLMVRTQHSIRKETQEALTR